MKSNVNTNVEFCINLVSIAVLPEEAGSDWRTHITANVHKQTIMG